jgi:hypothetical protein
MKQLIEDLIGAMEYHVEQTRPIHSTTVALQAAREAIRAQPEPVQEPAAYMYASIAGPVVLHRMKPMGVATAWCVQAQLENDIKVSKMYPLAHSVTPLYTTPPAQEFTCSTGLCHYKPAAPDLQAELDATNRQVEILSDALAESRREVAELKAVQEPFGYLFQHEETGLTTVVDVQQVEWGFEKNNPRHQKIGPVYTTPPAGEKK